MRSTDKVKWLSIMHAMHYNMDHYLSASTSLSDIPKVLLQHPIQACKLQLTSPFRLSLLRLHCSSVFPEETNHGTCPPLQDVQFWANGKGISPLFLHGGMGLLRQNNLIITCNSCFANSDRPILHENVHTHHSPHTHTREFPTVTIKTLVHISLSVPHKHLQGAPRAWGYF